MKKTFISVLSLVFIVGCTLPREYNIDVKKIDGCEDFDWNGRVTVRETYKGLFTGYTVDLIKLEARDGRAMLLDASGPGVETYVTAKVESCMQQTDESAAGVLEKQVSSDQ